MTIRTGWHRSDHGSADGLSLIHISGKKAVMAVNVILNLGVLVLFKYTGFLAESVNTILGTAIPVPSIRLPIGISFFTFQAMSYVIDVYRGVTGAQKNFGKVLLYISFFPQLIAGPIVKYHDIAQEIENRTQTVDGCLLYTSGCKNLIRKGSLRYEKEQSNDSYSRLHDGSSGSGGSRSSSSVGQQREGSGFRGEYPSDRSKEKRLSLIHI